MMPSNKLKTTENYSPHKYARWLNNNMRADDPRMNCALTLRTHDAFFDIEGGFVDFKWPYLIVISEHYPPIVTHVDEVHSLSLDTSRMDWWDESVRSMKEHMTEEDKHMHVSSESVDEWLENADEPDQDVPGREIDE